MTASETIRRMSRQQVSDLLYEVAKTGHYEFDQTRWLKKSLRQAVRWGSVTPSELSRYARKKGKP